MRREKRLLTKVTRTTLAFLMVCFLGMPMGWSVIKAQAQTSPLRIVVLPYYTEKGLGSSEAGYLTRHYRRIIGFINNQLVHRTDFEVINPFASDFKEEEYNRLMKRSREDSPLAAREMCRRYAVDVAYIVWLDVNVKRTPDGYCKVRALLEGEGYDSAGRDLGAAVSKTFYVTRMDCEDAIVKAEKEAAYEVGRTLTYWVEHSNYSVPSIPSGVAEGSGGKTVLEKRAQRYANLINVRLEGANEYEITEVFGKVLNTVRGVTQAKLYHLKIDPENPQACLSIWRVRIQGTDPFRLQANIMHMIHQILKSGGTLRLKGVPYRYTPDEVNLLRGIVPAETTPREIAFTVDRERVRDMEFRERHSPYKGR